MTGLKDKGSTLILVEVWQVFGLGLLPFLKTFLRQKFKIVKSPYLVFKLPNKCIQNLESEVF